MGKADGWYGTYTRIRLIDYHGLKISYVQMEMLYIMKALEA